MIDETPYAIGNADSIGLVVSTGIWNVEYHLKQAQDEGYAKFLIEEDNEEIHFSYSDPPPNETGNLALGENISVEVAREAMNVVGPEGVYGFIVPDYLLGTFIAEFPDKEVYRQR